MKIPTIPTISALLEVFSRPTFVDKLLFTKHLSVLLGSGVTIVESLDILAEQTTQGVFKEIITAVSTDIKNGQTFTNALLRHPDVFDPFYTSLIEIGEKSGTLDTNLTYLATQLAKQYAFQKKVKGILLYPTIVLSAAGIIGFGISLFVLPKLIDLFQGFDVALPLTTQILLVFASIMKQFGIFIGIFVIGGIFLLRYVTTLPTVKPLWQKSLLSLPIMGKVIANAELSLFCRSLGLMLKSGLPITQALEIQQKISSNAVFQTYVTNLLVAITNGKSLSKELETGKYPVIPLLMTRMIAVGEKTGKLDGTLTYLGSFFEEEVDDATRNLATLLEPVLLLIIGAVVAFVAFAVISPIYQLTGSIHK